MLEPGYIESEMTAKSASTMLMVDNETGVKAMVDAIEREKGRAAVPWWPWGPLVQLMRVLPPRLQNVLLRNTSCLTGPLGVVAHPYERKTDEVDAFPVRRCRGRCDRRCAHRRCSAGASAVRER